MLIRIGENKWMDRRMTLEKMAVRPAGPEDAAEVRQSSIFFTLDLRTGPRCGRQTP